MCPPEDRCFSACNANVAFFDGANDATPQAIAGVVMSAVFFAARTDRWLGYPIVERLAKAIPGLTLIEIAEPAMPQPKP